MSYNIRLRCGCVVYVSSHPRSGIAHTRIIEHRDAACVVRKHDVGARLALWELLPDPSYRPAALFVTPDQRRLAS